MMPSALKQSAEYLKSVPGFRSCSQKQLDQVDRLVTRVYVLPGETFLAEGVTGSELFIVVSGTAEVTRGGRVINTLGPGDLFGELALIDGKPRGATVTAKSRLELLIVGSGAFTKFMAEIDTFRSALLKSMAKRIRTADLAAAELAAAEDHDAVIYEFTPRRERCSK